MPEGVAAGDVTDGRAVVWSRADRPARMLVEYATTEKFENGWRRTGPAALESTDFTARIVLTDLPADQRIFYRVTFQDLADLRAVSEPRIGSFRTPPSAAARRDVTLAWSADTVGQGWGINPSGAACASTRPCGAPSRTCSSTAATRSTPTAAPAGGQAGRRIDVDERRHGRKVEGRRRRSTTTAATTNTTCSTSTCGAFNAEVSQIALWDDHEVRDNWYESRDLTADKRYQVKSVALLAARARQAFLEYNPMRGHADDPERDLSDRAVRPARRQSSRSICAAIAAPTAATVSTTLTVGVIAVRRNAARVVQSRVSPPAVRPGR